MNYHLLTENLHGFFIYPQIYNFVILLFKLFDFEKKYLLCMGMLSRVLYYCSVGVHTDSDLKAMINRMEQSQLRTMNLTNNDLAKDHLRHLVCFLSYDILYLY